MKIANIILAHKNPTQLLTLLDQFDGRHFHHFIHIDQKSSIQDFKGIAERSHVTVLSKRRNLIWGGFGIVQATLDGLKTITEARENYFYINLMSGQDFPIKPPVDMYNFLFESYENKAGEFFDIANLQQWPKQDWYQRVHLTNWTLSGRYFTENIINGLLPKREFYEGKLEPYGQSTWFTATDKFIRYALHYLNDNPGYLKFLKTVMIPDEFIFNSLLMNSSFSENAKPNLRYIDWAENKINPKTLRIEDFQNLASSNAFIARKFDDTVDPDIINHMVSHIAR